MQPTDDDADVSGILGPQNADARNEAWIPGAACPSQPLPRFTRSPPSAMPTTAAGSVTSVDASVSIQSRAGDADDGNARQRLRVRLSAAASFAAEHDD